MEKLSIQLDATERRFEPPFRWELTPPTALGTLLEGEIAPTYKGFRDHLLACCSRIVAFAGDSDLVFVGRSPESAFDYLSGLLLDTTWANRLCLLHFSMRSNSFEEVRREQPFAFLALRSYFEHLGFHPETLAKRPRPVCFIDLVYSGGTFESLITFLRDWALEIGTDWNAVRRKIRLVGVTRRTKNSPNTWRWQQNATWRQLLASHAIKNVSIRPVLWNYLGNDQLKVTFSYRVKNWGNPEVARPFHGDKQLMALRLAISLFELGRTPKCRASFAASLARETAMKEPWLRSLVGELRRTKRT